MARPLYEIAAEIKKSWTKINPNAEEYLNAMMYLNSINDNYYFDSGQEIVLRFLCWANTWRGEDARRIKNELKQMVGLK